MKKVMFELYHQGCIGFGHVEKKESPGEENSTRKGSERLEVPHQVAPFVLKKYWPMRGEVVTEI